MNKIKKIMKTNKGRHYKNRNNNEVTSLESEQVYSEEFESELDEEEMEVESDLFS